MEIQSKNEKGSLYIFLQNKQGKCDDIIIVLVLDHLLTLFTMSSQRGCCTIPHGKFSILTLIISIAAYVCAVHTAYSCQFVTVPIGDLGFYSSQEIKFGLGLWSYEDILGDNSFSCIEWNDSADSDILDATWIAARWLALCANVCIGIAIISCIVMTCIPLPVAIIKCLVFGLLCLGFFFESLVFIAFSSDVCSNINCQFSAGAGTAVAALILAMIAAAFAFKIPPCEPGNFTPGAPFLDEGLVGGPGTVKVQTTLEPDGTKKTVTTTVNADGSCTVEESIEKSTDAKEPEKEEAVEQAIEPMSA